MQIQAKGNWKDVLIRIGEKLGKSPPTLFVSVNKQYTVFGLSWHSAPSVYDAGFLCEVTDDYGNLLSVPMDAFDIMDDRMPASWHVRRRGNDVFFWPELFFQPFFFDDLSEGIPEVVEAFSALRQRVENELMSRESWHEDRARKLQ